MADTKKYVSIGNLETFKNLLDGSATIASQSGDVVTIKAGVAEVDGIVGNASGSDITLAAVATTGAAEDVSYSNTTSGLTATDVQAAIDEVAAASAGGVGSKTVYITETAGQSSDPFSKRYGVYQGATGSSASPVAGEKLADIDIPKDMVVESGSVETVKTADVPYKGAQVGDKYIDLVIANATSDHIYIPANSLVDIYTVEQSATQVQLAINNNVISATVVAGSITATELASDAVTTAKIADGNVTKAKLASGVQSSLDLADSAVQSVTESDATTGTNGTITVDGTEVAVKGLGSAAYTAATAYDAAGTASAAIADLDATPSQTAGADGLALALTEVDGVVTSISGSIAANTYDAYGAASTVQTTVVGTSGDAASANTVYGAKAYADGVYNAITSYTDAEIEALFE